MQFLPWRRKKHIHLDYAAATPVAPEVRAAMRPYLDAMWANPSALYRDGVEARAVIESHRTELARVLHVRPGDVTFTSGGTESNNLALVGVVEHARRTGRAYGDMEIVSTRIEHPSVLEALLHLASVGVSVRYVSVGEDGLIDMKEFESLLTEKTVLVTIGYVNAEVGVIQDIRRLSRSVRAWNEKNGTHVLVHTDACQAPLWLPCELDSLGVDLLSLDAGKCYGPKGVGVLVHRHWVTLCAQTYGGGQEGGLRSGTENTPLIVGCVRALVRAQERWRSRSEAVALLRDHLMTLVRENLSNVFINGSCTARVANNVHISIPGIDTEYATVWLDARGVAVSTRSACGAAGGDGSHVVREMSGDAARTQSTLRFTLGEETNSNDIETAVHILKGFVAMMSTAEERIGKSI